MELNATAALVPFVGSDGFSYSGCQLHVFSCGDTAGVGLAVISIFVATGSFLVYL